MLADYIGFFSRNNLGQFGFRWLHVLVGIMWIGLLYYFNFVQVPAFAAFGDEGKARNIALDKVARSSVAGEPLSLARNSPRYLPRVMQKHRGMK